MKPFGDTDRMILFTEAEKWSRQTVGYEIAVSLCGCTCVLHAETAPQVSWLMHISFWARFSLGLLLMHAVSSAIMYDAPICRTVHYFVGDYAVCVMLQKVIVLCSGTVHGLSLV